MRARGGAESREYVRNHVSSSCVCVYANFHALAYVDSDTPAADSPSLRMSSMRCLAKLLENGKDKGKLLVSLSVRDGFV